MARGAEWRGAGESGNARAVRGALCASYGFRREAQLPVYGLAEASLAVTVPPLNRGPLVDRVERETFTCTRTRGARSCGG